MSLAAALVVMQIWGPLWGAFGFRYIASGLMILGYFALLGVEELFRSPNPYARVHPLFGLQDLGPAGELHSSDPGVLLAGLPLLVGAALIILLAWLI